MSYQVEKKTKKYIVYLIILLVAYYLVEIFPLRSKEKNQNEIVSENIKSLENTTNELPV